MTGRSRDAPSGLRLDPGLDAIRIGSDRLRALLSSEGERLAALAVRLDRERQQRTGRRLRFEHALASQTLRECERWLMRLFGPPATPPARPPRAPSRRRRRRGASS